MREFKLTDKNGRSITVTQIKLHHSDPGQIFIEEAYYDDVEDDAKAKLSSVECMQLTNDKIDYLISAWLEEKDE